MSEYLKKKKKELEEREKKTSSANKEPSDFLKKKMEEVAARSAATPGSPNYVPPYMSRATDYFNPNTAGIAPIAEMAKKGKKEPWYGGWVQAGLLKDGYDFGDITRTIEATKKDIGDNVVTAVVDATENLIDTHAMAAGLVAYPFNPEFSNEVGKFVAKDLLKVDTTGKVINAIGGTGAMSTVLEHAAEWAKTGNPSMTWDQLLGTVDADKASLLGEKTDSLVQSASHMAGSMALEKFAHVPSWLTIGVNAFGSEAEQAYQQDAEFMEGFASASISAIAEVMIEKLTGGILTKTGLDDIWLKPMLNKIKTPIIRSLAKFGIKATGEGAEEVATTMVNRLGQMHYNDNTLKEAFASPEALQEYLDSFVSGALMGAGGQGIEMAQAKANGVDYVTEMTENEKKVFDKVYDAEVAEAAKDKKSTKWNPIEKKKIYDSVMERMQRGEISTDTIGEMFGGDSYKAYADAKASNDAKIKAVVDQLKELESAPNTVGNSKKFESLTKQLEQLRKDPTVGKLKDDLDKSVYGLVKDSRLAESYHEDSRRKQKFQADVSKYDAKQQETIKRAVDSGILNNTRRTHEFVDLLAKLSAKKGVLFDFTNNERLKETSFAVAGKTVNGYFDTKTGTIGVNIDSAKAINSVVGHEITHVLEGTDLYDTLQKTMFNYAKSKGEYKSRYDSLTELYKGLDADIEAELTADLVGDYLFTDADFVKRITAEDRNLAQKIYDEIKYMAKLATAGSKEARELERVKKAFEDAFKAESNAKVDGKVGVKHSLGNPETDNTYANAVRQGDMDTAQRMVNEAADANGFAIKGTHGTTNMFTIFDVSKSNIENDWGRGIYATTSEEDAEVNYASNDGADLANRIERLAEMMEYWDEYEDMDYDQRIEAARNQLSQGGNRLLHVAMRMENPVVVEPGSGGTFFTYEDGYDAETDEYSEPSGTLIDLVQQLQDIIHEDYEAYSYDADKLTNLFEDAMDFGGLSARQVQEAVADWLVDVYDEDGNIAGNEILRSAFERMGYDGIIDKSVPYKFGELSGRRYGGMQGVKAGTVHYIAFKPEQVKLTDPATYDDAGNLIPLSKRFNTANKDMRYSLSKDGEAPKTYGNYNISGKDIGLEKIAPINEAVAENATTTEELFPNNLAPVQKELEGLQQRQAEIEQEIIDAVNAEDAAAYGRLSDEYVSVREKISAIQADETARIDSLADTEAPPETIAPYPSRNSVGDPLADRKATEVSSKKVKAYMYENPEVKPFFQREAQAMLQELGDTTKGERWYNEQLHYESGGELGWGGTNRRTSASIAELLDSYGMSYADIEKGLNAIIEDNGAENIAAAKKIEFVLNDRLLNGYKDFYSNKRVAPNQEYINFLQEQQMYENASVFEEETKEAFDSLIETADQYAPRENIAPVKQATKPVAPVAPVETEAPESVSKEQAEKIAKIRKADPKAREGSWWTRMKKRINDAVTLLGDKGWAVENLAKKAKNRELEAKYDYMKNRSAGVAQEYIHDNLLPILDRIEQMGTEHPTKAVVEVNGETVSSYSDQFDYYNRHLLNIDRMSLDTAADVMRREAIREKLDGLTEKQIESLASERITNNTPEDRVNQIRLAQEYVDLGGARGKNKPVFGDTVPADISRQRVAEYEAAHPEFKELAKEVNNYFANLRQFAVKKGLITQAVADKWQRMYPHYVPISRTDRQGASVSVPLDERKTGVNNPFKRATGSNNDFEPLAETIAKNTMQIFRAAHRNDFGVELMNTLASLAEKKAEQESGGMMESIKAGELPVGTKVKAHDRDNIGTIRGFDAKTGKYTVYFENVKGHSATVSLDAVILSPINMAKLDNIDVDASSILEATEENDGSVLTPAQNGKPPQFTVFVDGKRVTYDITEDLYNALKPVSGILADTYFTSGLTSGYKRVLTEMNPFFSLFRNPLKDSKDVLFNSRHAFDTYTAAPKAMKEIITKGKYFTEFVKNGGKTTSYYDARNNSFAKKPGIVKKVVGFPVEKYLQATENIEMLWRLAEYIASRESGESVAVSMLDAARVTTNFGAGGDLTKWANRNFAQFLNPSVQGVMQNVRNVREAYQGGLKSSAILAAKVLATGLGGMVFNWLLWDDDEDYEELSDYVKQNYYCVWKTEDGKFVRIPKGRMEAVIQNGFEQMGNLITGHDEVDLETFGELVVDNLAPNNPIEDNLLSPLIQAANNKTWYGEDLVPTRLQDLPASEQFDESTDEISKLLGRMTEGWHIGNKSLEISPIKANYVMQQYGGGYADVILPMLTKEAEGPTMLAPIADEFVTDSVMKNQNVSDFYSKIDELTPAAKSSKATDEDILKSKYMNAISTEMSNLYKRKREIQNSNLSDKEKYAQVRQLQQQINELAKVGLANYENVRIDGNYATVGNKHYRLDEGAWTKISDKQYQRQQEVTEELGISPSEYWSKTDISFMPKNDGEYEYAYDSPGKYAVAKAVGGYDSYRQYSKDLSGIKATKDKQGNAINSSRKRKVLDYINNLDADYGTKIVLFKKEYPSDNRYNREIAEYVNGKSDLSYKEKVDLLEELGFKVSSDGYVTW